MKIGLTGASGFIGSRVASLAREQHHEITAFSRTPRPGGRIFSTSSTPDFSGLEAVIHLAGESILGLWTAEKKRRIFESRAEGTRRVVEALRAPDAPRILICASAIGFYGETGERLVDEDSPSGEGFLAATCRDWEAEAQKAEALGVRVVCVRIGFVIGKAGAMEIIRPVFSLGVGGNLGNGKQWMSGIHVDDVAGKLLWAASNDHVRGPVNAVLPEPFRNAEFTRTVGRILRRPTLFAAPAFLIRLSLGDLSHVLLDSIRVTSKPSDYRYRFATLEEALREALS